MSEQRCKTCVQWDNFSGDGHCGVCWFLKTGTMGRDDMPAPDQLLARGKGDEPLILTGPDFGCVHWESKDAK